MIKPESLTDDQINTGIGQFLGWRDIRQIVVKNPHSDDSPVLVGRKPGTVDIEGFTFLTNWCGDLNACHEAEEVFNPTRVSGGGTYPDERWGDFIQFHNRICERDGTSAFHSSSHQRAEALFLTMRKHTPE